MRWAVTQGELDRAVERHQPSSRAGICFFVGGGTAGSQPEPYKMTSSRFLVYVSDPSGICAHSPAPYSSISSPKASIGRSSTKLKGVCFGLKHILHQSLVEICSVVFVSFFPNQPTGQPTHTGTA